MVSVTGVAAAGGNNKSTQLQVAQVGALNRLGTTVNSIAGIVSDIKKIELKRLADAKNRIKFTPRYTKPQKVESAKFAKNFIGRTAPKFWEGLLKMLSGLFKLLVLRPILKWLSDPKNQEAVANTLRTLDKIFTWVAKFLTKNLTGAVDGLYNLLREDATWAQRIGGFMKTFVGLGAIFLGLRWLNPLRVGRTLKDFKWILSTFYNSLTRFKTGLAKRRGMRWMGGKWGKALQVTTMVAGTAYVAKKGMDYASDVADDPDPFGRTGTRDDGSSYEYGGNVLKLLPQRATGGWINGPNSGYPVSLGSQSGASPDFVGHGLEYVARKNTGENFVIPVDNAATRRNPGLMEANMRVASSNGFDIRMPRLNSQSKHFGLGSWLNNKGWGGNKGSSGGSKSGGGFSWGNLFGGNKNKNKGSSGGLLGTISSNVNDMINTPKQTGNWFSNFGQKFTAGNKGWQGRLGDWFKGGGAGQIGAAFGNEGLGNSIGGIFNLFSGGGSGKDGKATGWDIIKGIGGVASNFMKPGSKAQGWLSTGLGIGDILRGEGTFGQKLGQVFGSYGNNIAQLIGGKAGSLMQNAMGIYNNLTGGGGLQGMVDNLQSAMQGGVSGLVHSAGGAPINPETLGITAKGGGIEASKRVGKQMLSQGFTVEDNPFFHANKWNKMKANTEGFNPRGDSPVNAGGLHALGLGLNIADYRPGQKGQRLHSLADTLHSQVGAYKITEIVHDKWGAWAVNQERKQGPNNYGYPGHVHIGIAGKEEKQGGGKNSSIQAPGNMQMIAQQIHNDTQGGSLLEQSLHARSWMNKAGLMEQFGNSSGKFGNASTWMDLIDSTNIFKKDMSSADSALSWKAILNAQKDGYLQTALSNQGYDDAAINVLTNATNFTKSSKGGKDRTAYQVSFKNMFGRTDGNKEANAKISSEGLDGQSPNMTDKKKQVHKPAGLFGGFKSGSTMFPSQMPQGKQGSNVSNAKSAYSPVKSGRNDTASNTSAGSNVNSMTNKGSTSGRDKDDKSTMRMQQKILREKEFLSFRLSEKINSSVQATMASIEANNASVRSEVAAAQSFVTKAVAESKRAGVGNNLSYAASRAGTG